MSAQDRQTPRAFLTDWLDTHLGEAAQPRSGEPQSAAALAEACRTDAEKAGISMQALAEAVNLQDGGGSGLVPLIAVALEDRTDVPAVEALGGKA